LLPTYSVAPASPSTLRVNHLKRLSAVKRVRDGLPELHEAQQEIFDSTARFVVPRCGRRFGKSEVAKHKVVDLFLEERGIWWIAPTYAQAKKAWRDILRYTKPLDKFRSINRSDKTIEFGDGFIQIRTGSKPDNLRGDGLHYAVIDEFAFQPADLWPSIVRPMLMETLGGAMFPTTPNGMNHLHAIETNSIDDPEWGFFHFTSYDNPRILASEIDSLTKDMTTRTITQEIMAEYILEGGAVFVNVKAVADAPMGAKPQPNGRYVAGIDWGRDEDYTVIAVLDRDSGAMVELKRWRGIPWKLIQQYVADVADKWNGAKVLAEENSMGGVNIEALRDLDVNVRPFQTTAKSKPMLIDGLALAIERGSIRLLNDPVLIGELSAFSMTRSASGNYRYGAPEGRHDDTVIATALAWHAANTGVVRDTTREAVHL
jgi:hypothetical protein